MGRLGSVLADVPASNPTDRAQWISTVILEENRTADVTQKS
jgi:hypothetical protein